MQARKLALYLAVAVPLAVGVLMLLPGGSGRAPAPVEPPPPNSWGRQVHTVGEVDLLDRLFPSRRPSWTSAEPERLESVGPPGRSLPNEVSGVAVDQDGEPAVGASLHIGPREGPGLVVETDEQGRFRAGFPAPGEVRVSVFPIAPGWWRLANDELALVVTPPATDLLLELERDPLAVVEVRAVDAKGQPLADFEAGVTVQNGRRITTRRQRSVDGIVRIEVPVSGPPATSTVALTDPVYYEHALDRVLNLVQLARPKPIEVDLQIRGDLTYPVVLQAE